MRRLPPGTRVVARISPRVKMEGTIVLFEDGDYGIRFDKNRRGFHDLDGRVPSGYGYWVKPEAIEVTGYTIASIAWPTDTKIQPVTTLVQDGIRGPILKLYPPKAVRAVRETKRAGSRVGRRRSA